MSLRYVVVAPWKVSPRSEVKPLVDVYLSRIVQQTSITLSLPKSTTESEQEAESFLVREIQKLKSEGLTICCLDEAGQKFTSASFAQWLEKKEIQTPKGIAFCLGGAYGLPKKIAEVADVELMSLSQMTFPHELAMLVLVEQIYRARTIRTKHPYHHGEVSELSRALRKT